MKASMLTTTGARRRSVALGSIAGKPPSAGSAGPCSPLSIPPRCRPEEDERLNHCVASVFTARSAVSSRQPSHRRWPSSPAAQQPPLTKAQPRQIQACSRLHRQAFSVQVSFRTVWSVRIRSTTLVRLLHGLVLRPSGISGKMNISLDTTTIIAMLVVSLLSLCLATYHLYVKPPNIAMKSL